MVKKQKKQPEKPANILEGLDDFKVEHGFNLTKKEARGTICGFVCTVIFNILSLYYFYNRMHLFWTHEEDSYGTYDLVANFTEMGEVEYKETKFVTGAMLSSTAPDLLNVFESEELLSQYIRIYSAQAEFGPQAVVGGAEYSLEKELEFGCDFKENGLNYTKFTRPKAYTARFCVNPEEEYVLQGNWENNPFKSIHIKIERCTPGPTQACHQPAKIDRFIRNLEVITFYQDFSMLITDYDMKPPLDQSLNFKVNQLDPFQTQQNLINLAKNSYELDDVYSGLKFIQVVGGVQEGEYYKVKNLDFITNTYETKPKVVWQNSILLNSIEIHHSRKVYNFLFVLADFGGFQLIISVIIAFITAQANNRKSMLSILKKFFYIKTSDPNWLPLKADPIFFGSNGIYEFKLPKESKCTLCLYYFSFFGLIPTCSKNLRRTEKLLKQGEERLRETVNARSIMGILNDHHQVLKKMNNTDYPLEPQIFDFLLHVSSDEESAPHSEYHLSKNASSLDVTAPVDQSQNIELEDQTKTAGRGTKYKGSNGSKVQPADLSRQDSPGRRTNNPSSNDEEGNDGQRQGNRNYQRTYQGRDDIEEEWDQLGGNTQQARSPPQQARRNQQQAQPQPVVRKQPSNVGAQRNNGNRGRR